MTCASMRGHGCSMMLNLWLLMLTLIPVHGVTTSSQDSTFLMQCTTPSVVIANNEAKDYVVHVAHDGAALNDAGYKVRAELAASCSTRCTLPLNSPYIEAPVENGIAVLRSLRLSVGSPDPDASTTTCDVLFTLIYSENNETLCELPYAVLVDVEVYDILVQEPLRIMNAVATDFDFLVLKGGVPLSVEGATLHMTIDNTDERCRYEGVEALPTLSISNGSAHHPPVRIVYGANVLACSLVFVINDPVTRSPSQTVQRTIPTVSMKVTLAEPLAILPDVPLDFTVAVVFDGVLQVGTGYAITLTWSRHEDPACESVHLPSTALPLVSGRITFPDVIVRTADAVTHCHFDVTLIHIASQTLVHSVRTSTPVRSSHYHMHFDDRNGIVSGISNTLRIRVLSQDSDFTAIPGLKVSLSVDSNATPRCDMALNDSEVAVQADGTATFPSVHVHFPHNVYWCSFVATLYVTLSSVMLTQSLTKFVNIYHMTLMSPTEIRNGASQTYSVAVTQNGHALSSPDIRLHMAVAEESSSVCAFTQEPSAVVLTDAAGRAFFHDVTLRLKSGSFLFGCVLKLILQSWDGAIWSYEGVHSFSTVVGISTPNLDFFVTDRPEFMLNPDVVRFDFTVPPVLVPHFSELEVRASARTDEHLSTHVPTCAVQCVTPDQVDGYQPSYMTISVFLQADFFPAVSSCPVLFALHHRMGSSGKPLRILFHRIYQDRMVLDLRSTPGEILAFRTFDLFVHITANGDRFHREGYHMDLVMAHNYSPSCVLLSSGSRQSTQSVAVVDGMATFSATQIQILNSSQDAVQFCEIELTLFDSRNRTVTNALKSIELHSMCNPIQRHDRVIIGVVVTFVLFSPALWYWLLLHSKTA